jgi:N-acetylglucosaminyl-diphospho-decaprenol L-rhamnosyltransferase
MAEAPQAIACDRQDMSTLSVDVVVVAYNSRQCLRACVEPLVGIPGVTILVVDNACPERSFEVVDDLAGVQVIHTARNGGFAYGCNRGWRAGSSELVLFLNPDAQLEAPALARLAHVLDIDPAAGAVGPRTHGADGTLAWSIRRFPSLRSTYAQAFFLHRLAPRAAWVDEVVRDPARYDRPGRVDWLPGACLLVRHSTLEAVGGLDEGFFMYGEDTDFCWRVRRAALDVVYSPEAICVHEGGRSFPRARLLPVLAASRLHYAKRHHGAMRAVIERVGIGIGEGLRTMIGRGESGARRGHLRALGVILRGDDGFRSPSSSPAIENSRNAEAPPAKAEAAQLARRHFVTYWLVWPLLAVLAVTGNEVVDQVVWDERHVAGDDLLVAISVVAIAFLGSFFMKAHVDRHSWRT